MSTLISVPVAPLLERLFEEAAEASPDTSSAITSLSTAERERIMKSKTDYTEFYSKLGDIPLPVAPETGKLLYMLARSCKAQSIVEFGTSFGISTLHLAAALRDNGGGKLITTEFESSKIARAAAHLKEGGLSDLVEIREGDALKTLSNNLPVKIDLVLLDGAKALYMDVLALLEKRLAPGAYIVADNANYCPEYVQHVRSISNGYISIPCTDDVELSMRIIN